MLTVIKEAYFRIITFVLQNALCHSQLILPADVGSKETILERAESQLFLVLTRPACPCLQSRGPQLTYFYNLFLVAFMYIAAVYTRKKTAEGRSQLFLM